MGVLSPKCSSFSGLAPPLGLSGVQIGPGATAFTRMPSPTRFSDSDRVKAVIAQIGRAHVCTPVTNAHLVCRLTLEKKKIHKTSTQYNLQSKQTYLPPQRPTPKPY